MTEAAPIRPAYSTLPRLGSWMWKDRACRIALLSLSSVVAYLLVAGLAAYASHQGWLQPMSITIERLADRLARNPLPIATALLALSGVIVFAAPYRLRARVRAAGGARCPACLTPVTPGEVCPSCGRCYDPAEVWAYWSDFNWRTRDSGIWVGIVPAAIWLSFILFLVLAPQVAMGVMKRAFGAGASAYALFAISVGISLAPAILSRRARRSLLTRLDAARRLLCPSCHYDLSALTPFSQCPECGLRVGADAVRAYWRLKGPPAT